jgi:WD40 repeat protein
MSGLSDSGEGAFRPDPRLIITAADFARSLRVLRAGAGLSIRDLARKLEKLDAGAPSTATLGGWFSGSHLPTLKLLPVIPVLLEVCGETDCDEVQEWMAALGRVRLLPGPRPDSVPPYRGLASYQPEDAEIFCGRDALIASLIELAARSRADGGPVIVVGPSGSGKSSLLRAGLIPAVERGDPPFDAEPWRFALCTPGSRPLYELARQITLLVGGTPGAIEEKLLEDPHSAGTLLRAPDPPGSRLLIVVDQFEEVFTAEVDDGQRHAFIRALCSAASDQSGSRPLVALGLRADFYLSAVRVPELVQALQDSQLVVGPMNETELRQAITEPIRRARLGIADSLVALLLRDLAPAGRPGADAAHEPGSLPLLSHALLATWEHAKARTLTVEHYNETGGIQGAVAQTAEAAFTALQEPQQDMARRLFVRLVRIEDGASDTRRKVPLAELADAYSGDEAACLQEVLDHFVVARLLTVDDQSAEISHEVLLTAWPRLTRWLSSDRTWLRLHRRLADAAGDWAATQRDPGSLYRGGMLQMIREQAEDHDHLADLGRPEREFLHASIAQQEREERRERGRAQRRYQMTALLAVLAVIVASVTVYAWQLQAADHRNQALALSQLVASKADRLRSQDVSLSMQLALAAYRISPTPEARSSLLNSTSIPAATRLPSPGGAAEAVAVSQGGRLLATGTDAGAIQLWSVGANGTARSVSRAVKASDSPVTSLASSASGRMLADAAGTSIFLWNTANPAHPVIESRLTAAAGEPVAAVAVSPDGRLLAAGAGRQVYLWNTADPGKPALLAALSGPAAPVTAVAFTPGSQALAAGSDDSRVYLWDVTTPAHPVALPALTGPSSDIFSIAISSNGRYLAAGTGEQHSVYLWDISDPAHARPDGPPLTGPADWVNAVAFSPDSRTLAAGSSDSELWLFNLATRKPTEQLPHPSPVTAVVYRNNGSLVTVANDGTNGSVRVWNVPGPVITGPADNVFAVSYDATGGKLGIGPGAEDNSLTVWNTANLQHPFQIGQPLVNAPGDSRFSGSGALTPDGRTFAVGCIDGSVQLWNISNPARPFRIGPPIQASRNLVESVTISSDGRLLAVSSDDGAVHLFNIADPPHPVRLAVLRPASAGEIYQAAFSPGGDLLAAASSDHGIYLWNITDATRPTLLSRLSGFTEAAYSVTFTGSDHTVAAGGADDTVRLWNISNPRHPAPLATLTGPVSNVYSVAYDPQHHMLAGGSTDGTIWLWDITDPGNPVELATLTGPRILSVTFSPDGRTLAAGAEDHTVRLWDTDPAAAARWICAVAGQPITRREWAQYIPGTPYTPPCR